MAEKFDKNSLSYRMSLIINELNESQRQIALKSGVTPQTITDVIKGKVEYPSSKLAIGLYDAFRISIKWFLTGEGEIFDETWQSINENVADDNEVSDIRASYQQSNIDSPMTPAERTALQTLIKEMAEVRKKLALDQTQNQEKK